MKTATETTEFTEKGHSDSVVFVAVFNVEQTHFAPDVEGSIEDAGTDNVVQLRELALEVFIAA